MEGVPSQSGSSILSSKPPSKPFWALKRHSWQVEGTQRSLPGLLEQGTLWIVGLVGFTLLRCSYTSDPGTHTTASSLTIGRSGPCGPLAS